MDDLSTGSLENVAGVPELSVVVGDLRDEQAVREAVDDVEVVFHLGALPSVTRSVADPLTSHQVNVNGTMNVLLAARDAGVRRVVYASSSSVYGDTPTLPKHEDMRVAPLSPYAASKLAGEAYCSAFTRAFGLETVSLRFFNVFGPRQDPGSEYAAVIPRFVTGMLKGERPVVFGDGGQSRDFTYVANAVQACLLAASAGPDVGGEAINVACGERTTLLELIDLLNALLDSSVGPDIAPPRKGDVRHSLASIDKAVRLLGYAPHVDLRSGLAETVRWFAGEPAPSVASRARG